MKVLICVPILVITTVRVFAQNSPPNVRGTLAGISVAALAVDPQNPNTVYAGTNLGAFKSTDSGRSWNGPAIGLPNDIISLAVDPRISTTIYATAYNNYDDGVFKSPNGGASWTKILQVVGAWTIHRNSLKWCGSRNRAYGQPATYRCQERQCDQRIVFCGFHPKPKQHH